MSNSLLISFETDEQVSWCIFNNRGKILKSATQVSLDTIPRHKSPPIILIPSTQVLLTTTNIPSKQRQQIIQAIPYALEEQLIDDVENLHFAVGKIDAKSGNISVAIIAHSLMSSYLQKIGFLKPKILMPNILAVPKPDKAWGMLCVNDIVLVRTGVYSGFAIEADCLSAALKIALNELNPPQKIIIYNGSLNFDLDIPIVVKTHKQGALAWFVKGFAENKHLNLLQGKYGSKNKTILYKWKFTSILLLILAALSGMKQWLEYQQLIEQRQQLNSQIENLYRDTFPQARKIVNPRVQMQQKLTALRAQSTTQSSVNFLVTLNKITPVLIKTPSLKIKAINYDQNSFYISIKVQKFAILEQLKQKLIELEFKVKIHSINNKLWSIYIS
jgi:general secretion pathway protein L